MKNIWVLTIDRVIDYEPFCYCPMAYEKEEDALEGLKEYKDLIKEIYSKAFEEGSWFCDERDYQICAYAECYAEGHFLARLNCVGLQ